MKVISCELLNNPDEEIHNIQVCVELDEQVNFDDDNNEEKAGQVILDYVNNCDEFKEVIQKFLKSDYSCFSIDRLTQAFSSIECEVYENRDHWILE